MAVYFIVNTAITDKPLLDEYQSGVQELLADVDHQPLALDNKSEVLEGTPAGGRTVLLKFPSKEAFRAFYDSPGYQAIIGKRLASTDGFAILVRGLPGDE